jgi:outer membrane biosynthesis protein TonB
MATKLPTNNAFEEFLQSPKGDKLLRLNISRNTLIAFIFSLLIHGLILFFVVPKFKQNELKKPTTFVVELAQPEIKPEVKSELLPTEPDLNPLQERPAEPLPQKKILAKKANKSDKPPVFSVPEAMTTEKTEPKTVPQKIEKPPEPDMFAALNAKRAARDAEENEAAKINAEAAAREIGPSEDEKRDAKIKQNFKNGTNGIFEITRLESQSASFTFLGWTSSLSNARRQFFEVEAERGQDVRRVMIRRMISLIREHYQGDFDWESHRLNRTVVKSARLEDGAELEDFLMMEFFGTNFRAEI